MDSDVVKWCTGKSQLILSVALSGIISNPYGKRSEHSNKSTERKCSNDFVECSLSLLRTSFGENWWSFDDHLFSSIDLRNSSKRIEYWRLICLDDKSGIPISSSSACILDCDKSIIWMFMFVLTFLVCVRFGKMNHTNNVKCNSIFYASPSTEIYCVLVKEHINVR